MIDSLKREAARNGDQAAVVPVHRLRDIQEDLQRLKGSGELNQFQRYILSDIYSLEIPETGFEVRSIILVASPCPAAVEMLFSWKGKRIRALLPASYAEKEKAPVRVGDYLRAYLKSTGCHVQYAPRLPRKLLAVRSGLGRYGRNNICYVEGMGSYLNLTPYFSDIPCIEDTWQEIRQMDQCLTCQACVRACPTAAILPERFLINNERCLTYFNEAGGEWDFPDWIDPSLHHTPYGCMRCQMACPVNGPWNKAAMEQVKFTEDETALLMAGSAFERFPEALRQKVLGLGMQEYLSAIPRNLQAIFNQAA